MLAERDYAAWAKRTGLSQLAQAAIAHIRNCEPTRRVGGGRANVTGRYPSRKMGVTIQFESHRVELPAIIELEHDETVLEYFDQAPAIKLDYRSADGRQLSVLHTPDFFVIRADSAGWEECKTKVELQRLAERSPNRYRRDDDRRWVCPPGQRHAQDLGLYYRVRSSADIDWVFQRNIQFLDDYLRAASNVPTLQKQQVLARVAAQPGCSLGDLFRSTESHVTRDTIYSLIAAGEIFVDLHSASLAEPERVKVWLDRPPRPPISSAPVRPASRTALRRPAFNSGFCWRARPTWRRPPAASISCRRLCVENRQTRSRPERFAGGSLTIEWHMSSTATATSDCCPNRILETRAASFRRRAGY